MDYSLFINGVWTDSSSPERDQIISPSDEAVIGTVARGTEVDAQKALQAASIAQKSWKKWPAKERALILRKFADAIRT